MKRFPDAFFIVITILSWHCVSFCQPALSPWPMFRHDSSHTAVSHYTGPSVPAIKWSYLAGDQKGLASSYTGMISSPAVGSDGTVYIGAFDNNVYAFASSGALLWSYASGKFVQSSAAIGSNDLIYVGSSDNNIYALATRGSLSWSYRVIVGLVPTGLSPTLANAIPEFVDQETVVIHRQGCERPEGHCVFGYGTSCGSHGANQSMEDLL